MSTSASDVVLFTQAHAHLSELADQVKAGAENLVTKNGESYVALIDEHRLEHERIHLLLTDDACRGVEGITAGRTHEAHATLAAMKKRRTAAVPTTKPVKKCG